MADPIAAGELPDKQGRVGKARGGRPKGSSKAERDERDREATEAQRKADDARAREEGKDLGGLFVLLFHAIASRAGEHWELTEEEAERLGYRAARVDQKYNRLMDKYGAELALLGCGAMIVYPRLLVEAEKTDGKKVEAEDVTGKPAGAATPGA